MRAFKSRALLIAVACWPGVTRGQLDIVPEAGPIRVFSGGAKGIPVAFHNRNNRDFEDEIRTRVFQTTSATAVLESETAWKQMRVLSGQTIIDTARIDFPKVRAQTPFLIQWLDGANRVIGRTEVLVYPTNLLEALKPLAGRRAVGVFDPQNKLKPLLAASALEYEDLERLGIRNFSGPLAIIGPFSDQTARLENLGDAVADLARTGTAVVWIKAESTVSPALEPAVFTVPAGLGMVTVVRPRVVADLSENPLAQLNLVRAAQLAVKPDLLSLNNHEP
jgi:hypothetical protein